MQEPRCQHQAYLGCALTGSIEQRIIQRKPQEAPCFLRLSLFLYAFPATGFVSRITKEDRKELDRQFKNIKSNFKIAIVVDMWLTGFTHL